MLGAVEELGALATRADLREHAALAYALGRRRRFDLLKPLLDKAIVASEIAGLWDGRASPDDSVLVRDVLVPHADDHARLTCATFLALVGDRAMAQMIVDDFTPAGSDVERAERLGWLAPPIAALGDPARARALLDQAQQIAEDVFGEDVDDYGAPLKDSVAYSAAMTAHVESLGVSPGLPWGPMRPVSATFTNPINFGRYGENREQIERWNHLLDYALRARDRAAALNILLHVVATDRAHASWFLRSLAEGIPRALIDGWCASRLAIATYQCPEAAPAVVGALAEAGHVDAAYTALPRDGLHVAAASARLCGYARDPALVEAGLEAHGDERVLAQFVAADVRAGR